MAAPEEDWNSNELLPLLILLSLSLFLHEMQIMIQRNSLTFTAHPLMKFSKKILVYDTAHFGSLLRCFSPTS